MKKLLISLVILIPILATSCSKNIDKSNVLATENQNKVENKVENKERFYFIRDSKERFSRESFDKIKSSYIKKYNNNAKDDLISKSMEEVLKIFNDKRPTYEISVAEFLNGELKASSNISNKIAWIYTLDGEDSTAVYLLIENNKVINYKVDEFNGISTTYDNVIRLFESF